MRIAILGGGFTGLTAAYYLAKKGHKVTIFEKEKILGGLASGFKGQGWEWYLERVYHHLFSNDSDILGFSNEIGFDGIFFRSPETASLYEVKNNYHIFPLDTPQDLLKFPLLSLFEKVRAGLVIAFLKFSPFFSFYERETAQDFLRKTIGDDVWNILWQELFRKKFGKYAGNILASFFWARVTKRTKALGYIEGGFQTFIDYLEKELHKLDVVIKKDYGVEEVIKRTNTFQLNHISKENFDSVISTLPTPILVKIAGQSFPQNYLNRLKKIQYLHAVNLIIESEKPLLSETYWLNNSVQELPFMVLVQHTNFIDKKHYNNKHILYIGNYVDNDDKLLKMDKKEVYNYFLPYLQQINPNFSISQFLNFYCFISPFSQPIFDREFLKNKPDFLTPVKNFYLANLDMTYPYDRGINYATHLGKEIAKMI